MYSPADYSAMLSDEVRVRAYLDAIKATVRPGDVVLELGTGPGFFAVAACRAGASHVYAVEPDDIVRIGPEIARANGCADRITFMREISTQISIPRRADVLIEDMRGVMPLHDSRGGALVDAAHRLLEPGVRRVPRADTIFAAPCVTPAQFRRDLTYNGMRVGDIDLAALAALARSAWHKVHLAPSDLLGPPASLATLDYARPAELTVNATAAWTMEEAADVAGWCVWFDAELADGVTLTNIPGAAELVYGQAFVPLTESVGVAPGDRLALDLRVSHALSEPVWSWQTTHHRAGEPARMQRQSTLPSALGDLSSVRRSAPDYRPAMGSGHGVYADLIRLVDGSRTHLTIAGELMRRHPGAFGSELEALQFTISRLLAIESDSSVN